MATALIDFVYTSACELVEFTLKPFSQREERMFPFFKKRKEPYFIMTRERESLKREFDVSAIFGQEI